MLTANEYKHVMETNCRQVAFIAEQILDRSDKLSNDEFVIPSYLMHALSDAIRLYKQSEEDYKTALCKENGL